MSEKVAVVGTGLVGRAWGIVFARAGFDTCLYDPGEGVAHNARALIEESLPGLAAAELLNAHAPAAVIARIHCANSLAEALDGAVHMQESAPERVEVKRELHAELDRAYEATENAFAAVTMKQLLESTSPIVPLCESP